MILKQFKVSFANGEWRTLEAEQYTIDDALIVFIRNGEPVLTCVLFNVLFLEPVAPEPEKPFSLR